MPRIVKPTFLLSYTSLADDRDAHPLFRAAERIAKRWKSVDHEWFFGTPVSDWKLEERRKRVFLLVHFVRGMNDQTLALFRSWIVKGAIHTVVGFSHPDDQETYSEFKASCEGIGAWEYFDLGLLTENGIFNQVVRLIRQ